MSNIGDELLLENAEADLKRGLSFRESREQERRMHALAERAGLASFAAPGMTQLSPELQVALSEDPNMSDLDIIEMMTGVEGTLSLDSYSGNLVAQMSAARNDSERFDIWQQVPAEIQVQLQNDPEFVAPQPPPESGIWGTNLIRRLGGMITPGSDWGAGDRGNDFGKGSAVGDISQDIASGIAKPFKFAGAKVMDAFDVIDYPAKQVQRAIRTAEHLNIPLTPQDALSASRNALTNRDEFLESPSERARIDRVMGADSPWEALKQMATEVKASWDETEEAGFSLGAMDRTRNAFAGDEFKVEAAKMLASGKDIMTVAGKMSGAEQGTPEFAEVFAVLWEMQGDEQIVEVVSDLSRNRMSAGGAIVEAMTPVDRHSTLGKINSAVTELGIYMVVDPTIVGSKLNSIRKLARHGVNTGRMNSELYRLHELAKLAREADDGTDIAQLADRIADADNLSEATFRETRIAKAIMSDPKRLEAGRRVDRVFEKVVRMYDKTDTAYNESQLLEEFPHMTSLIPALNKIDGSTGINSVDDVWDAVRTNQATRTMLNTGSAGRDPRIFQLPHLSKTGQKWLETKSTWNDAIRWGDGSSSAYDEAVTELSRQFRASELDSEAYKKARQLLSANRWGDDIGKVAKMRRQTVDSMKQTAHALTTHIPRKNNVLSVAADGESAEDLANNAAALNDFKRLTGFGRKLGLPQQVADDYVDLFARGTTGDRHVLVRTFTAELLAESGNMSPEMAKLWDEYVELGNKIYSGGSMVPGEAWTVQQMIDNSATFAGELSKQVSIPSFDEITKAKWRTDTTRQIAGVPTDYLDVMMNRVWKPLVLMRVGFIARAAGEETISFMLRLGPTTLAKSYLSKTAVGMRKHAITGELVDASQLGAIENTVNGLAYKMAGWAKVSNDDVMKMSADLIDDPSELSRLQGLLDDRIRVGDDINAQKYQTQINEIIEAAEEKYLNEKRKGFWSRQVMDMHEWAQAKAMEQSPGWFTFNRNSVIGGKIPTKAELSRMMLGVDRNIDPHRLGRIHMGVERKFRHADGQEYSSAERLIAAHYAIMTQPSTARLLAKDVAATIGPAYMARRDDSRTFSRSLSQTDEYETSIVDGKLRTVRVRPLTGQWEFLNDDSPRMKQALGDAVARIGADPVMNQSGVMEMASSHVGSNTLKEITEKLGDDALDQINLVRRRLSEIRFEPEVQVLRELLAGTATPTKAQIEAVAKGDITMRNVITEVANNRRLRGKLFPIEDPTDLRVANFGELQAEMLETLNTYSRRVDYQPTQEQLAKASTVLKMPIIAPTPPGMVNLYSPMLDTRMIAALDEIVSTNPGTAEAIIEEALFSLQKAGYPAEDLDGLGRELLQQLGRLSPGSDGMTNFLRVSFADPRHAGIVAKSIEDRLQGDAQFRALMEKVPFKTQDLSTGVGKLTIDAKDLDNPVLSARRMDDSESTFLTPSGQFEVLDPQRTGIYLELEDGRMVDQSEYYRSREHYVDAVEVDSTAESVAAARARANAVFQKQPDIPTTSAEEMRAINNRNVIRAEVEDLREAVEFNKGTARADELAEELKRAEKRLESANQHIQERKIMAAAKGQQRPEVLRVERVDPPELVDARAEVARIKKLKTQDAPRPRREIDSEIESLNKRQVALGEEIQQLQKSIEVPGSLTKPKPGDTDELTELRRDLKAAQEDALLAERPETGDFESFNEYIGDTSYEELPLLRQEVNELKAEILAAEEQAGIANRGTSELDAVLDEVLDSMHRGWAELDAGSKLRIEKRYGQKSSGGSWPSTSFRDRRELLADGTIFNARVEKAKAASAGESSASNAPELVAKQAELRKVRDQMEDLYREADAPAGMTVEQKLDMLDQAQANMKALQARADEAYRAQVAAAEQSVQAVDRPVYLSELDELMANRPIGADEIAKREIKSLKDRREKLRAELMDEELRRARKAKRNRLSKKEERTVARRVGQHPDMKELNAEIRAVDSTEFAKESAEKLEAWHRKVEKAREKARLDEASFAEWEKEYAEYKKLIEIAEQGTTRTEYMLRFNEPLQPTGNVEWVNGATNEMALRALNEARVQDFMDVVTAGGIDVTGASDEILSEVIDPILRGVFDSKFHPHLVPNVELKPQWAPVIDRQLSGKGDMFNRLVQGWFQGVVDPMMSRIIRTPHYAVNMASSMPFAEDLYYMRAAMFQADVPPISDDVLDSIHALWRTDETELLDSGDEVAEAIVSLRNKTLHDEPRLQKALGLSNVNESTTKVLSAWANNRAQAYAEAVESASIRAVDLTVEFIDDHRFRSQFQQTVRQIIPFWFAEEQFLKRQVRMLAQSPDAIRKAALFMDGMRHTGMVTTDAQGNEIFVYPGTEAVNRFVLYNTGLVFGFEGMEAFAQPMTANVDFMFPGMKPTELASNPFSMVMPAPNPSPVVGVPLAAMTDRFPELGFVEQQLLGNRAGQDPMTQLVPSTVARLFGVLGVGAFGADRLASAQMRAMQALDIAGLDPGPDASTFEKQAYADRVRSYARVLNIMDATLYATAPLPAGAGVEFKDLEISKEFSQIMFESGLERNEAFAMFVERYPDYGVWQVYSSDNVTGAAIPQTEEGLQFLLDNEELLANNPHGAAWLAPPFESGDEDVWSRRAHDQLYAAGLRANLAPEEYLEEIYIREALPAYYDMIETAEREIFIAAQQGNDELADILEERLRIDKETYKRTHPVFADSLDDNLGRNKARKDQRDAILAMPREALPDGEHVDQVLNLMSSFAQFEREISALSDTHTKAADDQRVQLRNSFYAWASEYVKENPGARTYWQNVVQHDRIIGGYVTEFTYEYGSG